MQKHPSLKKALIDGYPDSNQNYGKGQPVWEIEQNHKK
jgi:hypothetical protein